MSIIVAAKAHWRTYVKNILDKVITTDGGQTINGVLGVDGIKFPATQVPSADPNTLDHYEKGDWDCTFNNSNVVAGKYIKTGNRVWVTANLTTNAGGASGTAFGGLPFTVINSLFSRGGGVVAYQNITAGVTWQALPLINTDGFQFYLGSALQEISASKIVYIEMTYLTA